MIPKSLSDILEKYDPEDFNIVITNVDFRNHDPKIEIQLSIPGYFNEKEIIYTWTIETEQYRQSKISFDFSSSLQINSEHPLLWQFSDIQSSIYFNGQINNKEKLFMDLYEKHKSLFGYLISFENNFNNSKSFTELINSGNGLLANGPQKLLLEYGTILETHNVKHSIIGESIPTYWDGEKHVPESGNAKVLFIDNSYIIADAFKFSE